MITDDIKTAFPELDLSNVGDYFSEHIAAWKKIYEGKPKWSETKKTGLYAKGNRPLNMLNAAKVLADELTALVFSEQVDIFVDDEKIMEYVTQQLENNGFWKNIIELLPKAFALGGCAFKVFVKNKKVGIEYIHADRFMPIEWNGKTVTSAVIEGKFTRSGHFYTLFEYHKGGKVEYRLFCSDNSESIGKKVSISEVLSEFPETVDYGADIPMFVYFKPAVSNNVEYDTPLGMSVFANATDTLKAIDVTFDSLSREVVLGKKRIIVPSQTLTQYYDQKSKSWVQAYDTDDEAYVAFNSDDAETLKITDNTTDLRIQEHIDAINAQLNILCFQTGLSAGSLSFDTVNGLKTATEVVSQESKTQRTVRNNKNLITETLEELVQAIIVVGRFLEELPSGDMPDITIGWNDNVIIDDNTMIENTIKLYNAGLLDLKTAVMRANKCDEETAGKLAERIKAEQSVGSADFFGDNPKTEE